MLRQMTVSDQPRPWASYTNVSTMEIRHPKRMNSAEEISTYDNNSHYCSPVLARKSRNSYNFPDKSPKKDKKWSFGSLFRRKKKESDSSSEEENQRNFLQKKKKKPDKRKRVNNVSGFDHVIPSARPVALSNGVKNFEDVVPTRPRNFIPASDFTCRLKDDNGEITRSSNNSLGSPSVCSLGRRKKEHVKARAEARRDTSKGEESSDDDSQLSLFKSDDSISKQRDGSLSRRSRAARTQRYLRRRSKDDELRDHIKINKLETKENKSPILNTLKAKFIPPPRPNFSGLTTIPPSHSTQHRYRYTNGLPNKYLSYHAPYNDNGNKHNPDFNNQRSLSCDSSIHTPESINEVELTNKYASKKHPPPPPPRDPRRIITVQNGDGRPISYSFENGYNKKVVADANHNILHKNFRSTSEDHIPTEPLQRVPLHPRPSSATPETNRLKKDENQGYRYLTDKNPRSRRPICIRTETVEQPTWSQKTFNFWRKKDEEVARVKNPASPLMFTAQTHVTTNIFVPNREGSPFRPILSSKSSPVCDEIEIKRKSSNLEDALCELEAIYNSLHLGDEDLLERAEKREAAARLDKLPRGAISDSGFGFDPNFDSTRKKRLVKKSEPDVKTDDMAFRKLNRTRYNTINNPQSTVSNISYLLASPVFNAPVEEPKMNSDEPDTTFDDVVFRSVMHTNNTLKVPDPQPPFGIPMGPISPASNSDYLHITPEPQRNMHSKKIPDVIKDDLAYRSLRKDTNKATALAPFHINEDDKTDGFKKKRAVRSLSANIGNLIHKHELKPTISVNDYSEQNITDVADALEMARKILRDKEEKINATRQAFMSDGELKYRRFDSQSPTDQRKRFMNEMSTDCDRLESKPPTPDRRSSKTSKESTPIPSSQSEDSELKKQLRQSTLDELLTSLAVETRENSDKITEELNSFDGIDETKLKESDKCASQNSEYDKLCEKLLQCANSADTEELSEEVSKIKIDPIPEIVANIVLLPSDRSKLEENPVSTEVFSESDHDYVNLQSDEDEESKACGITESKDDLLAAFEAIDETLRKMTTEHTDKGGETHSNCSKSCDVTISSNRKMSQLQSTRAERMAQYKEERRKQLASQFAPLSEPQTSVKKRVVHKEISSSSEEPRTTRASRLRAAASVQEEKTIPHSSNGTDAQRSTRLERDKSSKRKSNLNRALNSEEIPQPDSTDDLVNRRRRRRFFPPEILHQPSKESSLSDNVSTASYVTNTAISTTRIPLKKSELSIHMENARKGQLVSYSDMGKSNRVSPKKTVDPVKPNLDKSDKSNLANKENRTLVKTEKSVEQTAGKLRRSLNVSKRMDELTALTQDTLARVERLAIKTRDTNKVGTSKKIPPKVEKLSKIERDQAQKHSILKKKEEPVAPSSSVTVVSGPVSILKRKISLDDYRSQSGTPSTSTPPVTFSPNVVDPATNRRRQGILKKRRSLDESQVLRHRSCSPEVAARFRSDSRSILKNQRRSSLEEILRTQSPESGLHSILKRRSSRVDDELDPPINSPEPHGILKRRSGSSSAGSNTHTPHVSIATAVILAAAGGAEMVLESNEQVKPILKKRSFSEEQGVDVSTFEVPKPILKKKSSTDTDDCEEKPKKPILKNSKNSIEDRDSDVSESSHHSYRFSYQRLGDDVTECEVKPILKQSTSRENSPRPRLSFCSNDLSSDADSSEFRHRRSSRRSHTVCTDFNVKNVLPPCKVEDRELSKPRPLSVCDMVLNIEKRLSTGAIPKTSHGKRHGERYRTQPVTYHELEASRNSLQKSLYQDLPQPTSVLSNSDSNNQNAHSLLDLTTSFDSDHNLNSFLSSSLPNTTFDSGISGKMSSDSAFQSLGDGLELENENLSSPSPVEEKCVPAKLQMKALAEEAKNLQLKRGVGGFKPKSRHSEDSRFSTRSTVIEQEAKRVTVNEDSAVDFKLDRTDPARLSISDRIKLFSDTISCNATKYRSRSTRFQSQPVTVQEVESARGPSRKHNMFALDSSKDENVSQKERKGILKSKLDFTHVSSRISPNFQESLKSVLKKSEEVRREGQTSSSLRSILKPESSDCALDEGISSDESQSGSEFDNSARNSSDKHVSLDSARILTVNEKLGCKKLYDNGKTSSDDTNQTSDGDSSGGREVRSIIEGGDWLARKRHRERVSNEGFLYKSKSQGVIRDEEEIKTPGIRRSLTNATMPQKIAELQAKLQQSGDNEWRKRIPKLNNANEELSLLNVKNIYNDELTDRRTILAARKDQLDAASKQWRNRVEQSDAVNFSVAGRMQLDNDVPTIPINIPSSIKTKRTPKAKTFKGKESGDINTDSSSLPSSPEKNGSVGVKRSTSLPGSGDTGRGVQDSLVTSSRKVKVERPDNITFTSFFESIHSKSKSDVADITVGDFDIVSRQSSNLLVQKRTVRVQRRREATKNPIKALAARLDIADEYTEVTTGLAEKEKQRLNIEKIAKSSNFAVEALAGLASKEDFNSVALKRSSSLNSTYPPFNELMLLQIKGRRFVQTRLVEPIASSINEGDCYILVTYNAVYNYIGAYANVIEQSRAADIVNSIQQKSDLGCKCDKVITINSKKIASCGLSEIEKFWKLLGAPAQEVIVAKAGHPDEDEIYETSILGTNMIYEYQNDELVPVENYWGTMPKIEMLSPMKTFVFDFGSEMYVWSGKNALLEDKKKALKLARELWNEGYNYTECGINPLKVSLILGSREHKVEVLTDTIRPKWALFAKLTQHRETVLFKEKFLDWPDYGRVIKVRQNSNDNNVEVKFDFKPCSIEELCKNSYIEPDLVTDGMHLGRGLSFYDEETNRMFNFTTRSVTCWVILEYTHEKLPSKSIGQFFDGNSYIVRWEYCANTTGRGLSGQPSKHVQSGRDLCVYFCWQGSNATINEKGAAALLTIQLDSENARQIRVLQGSEPPVFLNLFKGDMVIHSGKHENPSVENHRLYICRGEIETETFLTEVPCSMRSLRSRASYVLVSCKSGEVTIWNGCKSSSQTRLVTLQVAERIIENELSEFGFSSDCDELSVVAVEEGSETKEFMQAVGGEKRQLYMSLLKKNEDFDYTPKLFHLTSISGKFEAREQMCPHRSNHITPYPHWQNDLYSVSQPALFMLDNKYEVWLWQGWWPELENDSVLMDQTGSGAIRWQEERKAAMQTVVDYCKRDSESKHVPAYLVWAGLEPLAFTNLFPFWSDRDEVTELNMQDGKKPGEAIVIEKELALLTRSTYPLDQLLQRPLPDGVDPTHLENYLSPDDFSELMSMTLEEFQKLPTWKQTSVKKEKGLF